jgi:mycoredoxin
MNTDLYSLAPSTIVLYGVSWCGDCRRARRVFAQIGVPYADIDIDADEKAEVFVKQVNHGNRSVPTIIFPDGSILVEPHDDELTDKLKSFSS